MRCRERRRADIQSSQIDDRRDHLVITKTPRPLTPAIAQGLIGWYRNPKYQTLIPRYNPIRPNIVLLKALTDQNSIGGGRMYSGQISQDFQTVHSIDCPRGSHDRQANAAYLSDWAFELVTLLSDQIDDQLKHCTAAMTPNTHSSLAHYSVPKLLDFMPKLLDIMPKLLDFMPKVGPSWHSTAPFPHHYPRPYTAGLETWISQAESTLLHCISDANDNHVQANTIDDYFPRHRDG
jgi:hypothetical protein